MTYSKAKDKRQRIAAQLKLYGRFMLYFRCYIIQIKLNNLSASRGASSLPSAHLKANALPPQGIGKAPWVYVVCKTSQFSCFPHTHICVCVYVCVSVYLGGVCHPTVGELSFFLPFHTRIDLPSGFLLRPWNGFVERAGERFYFILRRNLILILDSFCLWLRMYFFVCLFLYIEANNKMKKKTHWF